jgi:hypothetical protein
VVDIPGAALEALVRAVRKARNFADTLGRGVAGALRSRSSSVGLGEDLVGGLGPGEGWARSFQPSMKARILALRSLALV